MSTKTVNYSLKMTTFELAKMDFTLPPLLEASGSSSEEAVESFPSSLPSEDIVKLVQDELSTISPQESDEKGEPLPDLEMARVSVEPADEPLQQQIKAIGRKRIEFHGQEGKQQITALIKQPGSNLPRTRSDSTVTRMERVKVNFSEEISEAPNLRASFLRTRSERKISEEESSIKRSFITNFGLVAKPENTSFNIPDSILKEWLPYFSQVSTKLYFSEKAAEEELSACLERFPEQMNQILDVALQLREELPSKKLHRFRDTFVLAFAKTRNLAFLHSYFEKHSDEITSFAAKGIEKLIKNKTHNEIIQVLSSFTQMDLMKSTSQTAFRNNCLSSALCKEYGSHLWEKELKGLSESISKKLKKHDLYKFALSREVITKFLSRNPKFEQMDSNSRIKLIDEERKNRTKAFAEFVYPIIEEIYAMGVPPQFSELLQMRRFFIQKRFTESCLKEGEGSLTQEGYEMVADLSRTYVAELFFFRILNPHIRDIDSSPVANHVLTDLTKILQCLASQAPFTQEKGHLTEFNDLLFVKFLNSHYSFFDLHSQPRKEFK